ncbi:hypothetical protein APE_0654.1 [Aeropyrum pernix K1]|uniref:Uncharacterized protein n=1 Tax=Aeropyrum pernix (strain ATCC 700893 / DSM 11879 / JCM 9820 / NBRC 100138 / K1) TaxID=272557 RepID=Q9YEC0_AERPE|nr:hypothetical protein [Aeropyrum pernix]BAA79626.2 hypothetical protein APE_0654.1 [Aeropyrum pernix K1]
MSAREVFGRATNVLLTLIILVVIAYSVTITVEPRYALESDVVIVGVDGDRLVYSMEPVFERGKGYILVRTPSPGYTLALEPVEGGVRVYVVEKRTYPLPLPGPAWAVDKGVVPVEGLAPGCSLRGVEGSRVEGPAVVKSVLALALSRNDTILLNLKPDGEKPRAEFEVPVKVGKRSFKGGVVEAELDLSRVSEVRAGQGKTAVVYMKASVRMVQGDLVFDCQGKSVSVSLAFVQLEPEPGVALEVLDTQEQLREDVILPSGSYECLATRNPVEPGKTVYTNIFDMDNLSYLYTIDLGDATIGVNAGFAGFKTRVTVVSGLEEVKTVCILKSVSGDLLPILSSASFKTS